MGHRRPKLGHCTRCLRAAAAITVLAAGLTAASGVLYPGSAAVWLFALLSLGGAALTGAHLLAFGLWMRAGLFRAESAAPAGSVEPWSRAERLRLLTRLTWLHLVATLRPRKGESRDAPDAAFRSRSPELRKHHLG